MYVCVCGALVAEGFECARAVQEVYVLIPSGADAKTFAEVGDFLTTSVSAWLLLSKESRYVLLTKLRTT